jgi:(p)ppGpp synthase/HD superfamily hydrolase
VVETPASAPDFVRGDPLLEQAYDFAREGHHGPRREADTSVDHPVAVAELLHSSGFDCEVVAAALLHDVVEDIDTELAELAARFGSAVCGLVQQMTEDQSIDDYQARKAEHRKRIAKRSSVAAIYAADKLANTRAMNEPTEVPQERLEHYQATLEVLCDSHPEVPFLRELREELERIMVTRASTEGANDDVPDGE